ncbi:MAG: hypothetical protein AB7S26_05535 [Sandaracinaceae bacterium]
MPRLALLFVAILASLPSALARAQAPSATVEAADADATTAEPATPPMVIDRRLTEAAAPSSTLDAANLAPARVVRLEPVARSVVTPEPAPREGLDDGWILGLSLGVGSVVLAVLISVVVLSFPQQLEMPQAVPTVPPPIEL